jgi:hypothetical protein
LLTATAVDSRIEVPQGQYRLMKWTAHNMLNGRTWNLQAAPVKPPSLKINSVPSEEKLISPIVAILQVERYHDAIKFFLALGTQNGDAILKIQEGSHAPTMQIRVLDTENNPWARLKLKPQSEAGFEALWQPPKTVPLRLVARLELDTGPFVILDAKEIELSVLDFKTP